MSLSESAGQSNIELDAHARDGLIGSDVSAYAELSLESGIIAFESFNLLAQINGNSAEVRAVNDSSFRCKIRVV